MIFRAMEYVDVMAIYGCTWLELERPDQKKILGYAALRLAEEGGALEE